jgi:hypothetical protein
VTGTQTIRTVMARRVNIDCALTCFTDNGCCVLVPHEFIIGLRSPHIPLKLVSREGNHAFYFLRDQFQCAAPYLPQAAAGGDRRWFDAAPKAVVAAGTLVLTVSALS